MMVIFPVPLHTERLTLREPDPTAAEAVNSAIRESFDELHRWLPWADHLPSPAETHAHLTMAQEQFRAGDDCGLLIWTRDRKAFVGAIGLHPRLPDPAQREIGYWIRSSAAGQGYATEAARAVAHCALRELGIAGLQIHCSERNVASQRVAEGAGFARAAVRNDGRIDPDGQPASTWIYLLTT